MPRNIRFPGCQRAGRPMFMPADAGQILRQMSRIRLLLHPAHHAAQFLADLFDQVLENGLVDFAVVTSPVEIRKPLHKIPIFPFQEILIGGSKYASLSAEPHHLGELSEYPFISLAKDTGTRELYAEYFLNHSLAFHPDMEAATTDQILPMVEYNLGIGFYPEELARDALKSRTVCRIPLIEEAPKREICLIINPRQHQNAAAKELIGELLERV